MILVLDNYDSFVHNVARGLREVGGGQVVVVRSDALDVDGIRAMAPARLVISPGPCTPREAGISVQAVRAFAGEIPILGICLGHQAVAEAFGARIIRARHPLHGQASPVTHRGEGLLGAIPSPFSAGRYHSLTVEEASLPSALVVEARSDDGEIMALRHRRWPVWGLQFHPESILTPHGPAILRNFLAPESVTGSAGSAGSESGAGALAAAPGPRAGRAGDAGPAGGVGAVPGALPDAVPDGREHR